MAIEIYGDSTDGYLERNLSRQGTLGQSTMKLLESFMSVEGDDYDTAKQKVQELSNEISTGTPSAKMDFILGSIQPLIDQVNASVLVHMTAAKKTLVIDILNKAV